MEPDKKDDIDKGPGKHYYSCVNAKGRELEEYKGYYKNRPGELSPSARTLYRANYTAALSYYKSGDTEKAMVSLGRALHFVSDIGCTPHVANMKHQEKASNVHYAFEKHINTTYSKHSAQSFDKRLLKYYEKDDPADGFNKLSRYAGRFVEDILHLDPRAFDDTAKNTLPYTQQNVMAVLLKFYDDCNRDKGNFLTDGKLCTFRNEATGLILTVTKKGLTLEEPDKELEQKLKICLKNNGCFALETAESGYVNASMKGYEQMKDSSKAALFRAEALGNRRFLITNQASGFVKVICNSKNAKVGLTDLEPDDKLQVWIIN